MEEKAEERKEPDRKSDEELRELIRDFVENKIFTDRHIHRDEQMSLLAVVFLPLTFGAANMFDAQSVGLIYERLDQAGPRSVNGYPCFTSMQLLHVKDWTRIRPVIAELLEKRQRQLTEITEIELPTKEE